jgi:hypothetical protein
MNNRLSEISVLTFDQDWAPDFICESLAEELIRRRIKSTWFITNTSPFLQKLRNHPNLFELAIHPNFLNNSTHGKTTEEVLTHICNIVPEATGSRSHAVFQYGAIMQQLRNIYNITWDLTMFLYEQTNIQPVKLLTAPEKFIWRIPVFWADDHEFFNPARDWDISKYKTTTGIKIFSFHPIHLYLNSHDNTCYEKMKADLPTLNADSVVQVNKELGCRNAYSQLLDCLDKQSYFIKDILNGQ